MEHVMAPAAQPFTDLAAIWRAMCPRVSLGAELLKSRNLGMNPKDRMTSHFAT